MMYRAELTTLSSWVGEHRAQGGVSSTSDLCLLAVRPCSLQVQILGAVGCSHLAMHAYLAWSRC